MTWSFPDRIIIGPFETQWYVYWFHSGDYMGTQTAHPTDFTVDSVNIGDSGPVTVMQGVEAWYDPPSNSRRYKYYASLQNTSPYQVDFHMAGGSVVEPWSLGDFEMIGAGETLEFAYWFSSGVDHGTQLASTKEQVGTILFVTEQGVEGFVMPDPPHHRGYKYRMRVKNEGNVETFFEFVGGGVT